MDEEDELCPSEFYLPEDLETFDVETETGITECHIINNLLIELARAVLGNIDARSWQYGPSEARSVLPRPRINISQYGPINIYTCPSAQTRELVSVRNAKGSDSSQ